MDVTKFCQKMLAIEALGRMTDRDLLKAVGHEDMSYIFDYHTSEVWEFPADRRSDWQHYEGFKIFIKGVQGVDCEGADLVVTLCDTLESNIGSALERCLEAIPPTGHISICASHGSSRQSAIGWCLSYARGEVRPLDTLNPSFAAQCALFAARGVEAVKAIPEGDEIRSAVSLFCDVNVPGLAALRALIMEGFMSYTYDRAFRSLLAEASTTEEQTIWHRYGLSTCSPCNLLERCRQVADEHVQHFSFACGVSDHITLLERNISKLRVALQFAKLVARRKY